MQFSIMWSQLLLLYFHLLVLPFLFSIFHFTFALRCHIPKTFPFVVSHRDRNLRASTKDACKLNENPPSKSKKKRNENALSLFVCKVNGKRNIMEKFMNATRSMVVEWEWECLYDISLWQRCRLFAASFHSLQKEGKMNKKSINKLRI